MLSFYCTNGSDSDSDPECTGYEEKCPLKNKKPELKYDQEFSDGDHYSEITKAYYTSEMVGTDRHLYIKYAYWTIEDFPNSEVFDGEFLTSKPYRSGDCNEFQFYFGMANKKIQEDIHFGVYLRLLNKIESEGVQWTCDSYLINYRGKKLALNRFQPFPTVPGFQFVGSIPKNKLVDDYEGINNINLPNDDLNLAFKFDVNFKNVQSNLFLEKLIEDNKEKDITLIVEDAEFEANKAILKARSPVFTKLLDEDDKTYLEILDVESSIMKQLLIFMYTGYVKKLFCETSNLYVAAKDYKIKDLKTMCNRVLLYDMTKIKNSNPDKTSDSSSNDSEDLNSDNE